MTVDESGQEETKLGSKPVKKVSIPLRTQPLSSTDIETAPEAHPAFLTMPRAWGEGLEQAEVRV